MTFRSTLSVNDSKGTGSMEIAHETVIKGGGGVLDRFLIDQDQRVISLCFYENRRRSSCFWIQDFK